MGSRYAPPPADRGRKVAFVVPVDRRLPDRRRLVVAKQIFVQPKRKAAALDHLRVTFDKRPRPPRDGSGVHPVGAGRVRHAGDDA